MYVSSAFSALPALQQFLLSLTIFRPAGSHDHSPGTVQKLKTADVVSESRRKHGLRARGHSTLFRDSGRIRCRVAEDGYGQPATFTDRTPVKMAATA